MAAVPRHIASSNRPIRSVRRASPVATQSRIARRYLTWHEVPTVMSECLFCKIANGELPAEKVHDDGELFAIKDINPAAPTHLLIIPHRHIPTIADLDDETAGLVGRVYRLAADIAREAGAADNGYRVVSNCNRDGGQTVYHIHFHLLFGRAMGWPPG